MNREGYARFFERLGHRVVTTGTNVWYEARARVYMSLPNSMPIEPQGDELTALFARPRCWGVRFPAPAEGPGRLSYALVLDDPEYDLASLSANARSKVRRGVKQWTVERVDPAFVRAHGIRANTDTLARLLVQKDPYDWNVYWDAVAATPDVEVWAAFEGTEIAAYVVIALVDGIAEILTARSQDATLKRYPNNALVFTAVRDLLHRPGLDRVFFGVESLDLAEGVEEFKFSLGFRRLPIRQRIVFPPFVDRLLRHRFVGRAVRNITRLQPRLEVARKLEGLLIFHGSLAEDRGARKEAAWTS